MDYTHRIQHVMRDIRVFNNIHDISVLTLQEREIREKVSVWAS